MPVAKRLNSMFIAHLSSCSVSCYRTHKDACSLPTLSLPPTTTENSGKNGHHKELPTPDPWPNKELLDIYNRSEAVRLRLSAITESTDQMSALRSAIQRAIDGDMNDEFSEFLLKVNKELQ